MFQTVRRAVLWKPLGKYVECNVCERRCRIAAGERGFCKTRENRDGELYTLVYGDISSISANPIEKKPFYHFFPGTVALTVGSWSCNFTCPWCQNWEISKFEPRPEKASYLSPERFILETVRLNCAGTSISFNEPTLLFEYSLDVFRLAKEKGLYNTFVTNGYMTTEALRMLREAGLDAMSVDVKGDNESVRKYCSADVEVVWRNIREAKKMGIHVEVVNLVIPGVNDREEQIRELARRHVEEAGDETPLHFTAYFPHYEFRAPPTPVKTLEKARKIAIEEGVKFVYIGNVPGHPYENTYCPDCGTLLIKRYGFEVVLSNLKNSSCPACCRKIPIVK